MTDVVKEPSRCNSMELALFTSLVEKGGEVVITGLEKRITEAYRLAFHYEGADLAGVVALKRPHPHYKDSVFRKAQIADEADGYSLELGWAFTKPGYEGMGICTSLAKLVIKDLGSEHCYSTVRANNKAMRRVLEKIGFRRSARADLTPFVV